MSVTLSVLDVAVGSSESVNEKIRHTNFSESPPLLDIKPPHNIVGGDTPVERRRKGAEPVFAKFFKGVVHFLEESSGSGFYHAQFTSSTPVREGSRV